MPGRAFVHLHGSHSRKRGHWTPSVMRECLAPQTAGTCYKDVRSMNARPLTDQSGTLTPILSRCLYTRPPNDPMQSMTFSEIHECTTRHPLAHT